MMIGAARRKALVALWSRCECASCCAGFRLVLKGAQEVPTSSRQLTSSLGGIFASKVTKVSRAAWAQAQRYASVHRFGEVNGPSVNASQVSRSSLGSTK